MLPELAVYKTIDLFQEGKTGFFVKEDMGQTNEQQHRFNEWRVA